MPKIIAVLIAIAGVVLAPGTLAAPTQGQIDAGAEAMCKGYMPTTKGVCKTCFRTHWPKAARCAERCAKGDAGCLQECQSQLDADVTTCTADFTRGRNY